MTVNEWVRAYGRAWEEKDPDAAASLFAEESLYRDEPFSDPYAGRDGVRTYWRNVTATQEDVRARFGEPVVSDDGRRAAVDFWVTMLNNGAEATLVGILILHFAEDGLCDSLREAWHYREGRTEPFADWGTR